MALAAATPYELVSSGPQGQRVAVPYPSLEECQRAQQVAIQEWQRRAFAAEFVRRSPPPDSVWYQAMACVPAGTLTEEYRRSTGWIGQGRDWGEVLVTIPFVAPY